MKPAHIALALLMVLIWGVNFIAIEIGLESFPPLLLAGLRFVVAALPALVLPKPAVRWATLAAIGTTLFVGQYAFLFTGMAVGMPPGLASITLQVQAFVTIGIAASVLGERPTARQIAGSGVALIGLLLIATTAGGRDVTVPGLGLTLAAAVSWAVGNVLLRQAGKVDALAMISWLSLVPPLPLIGLSLLFEGPAAITLALADPGLAGIGALLYISVLSTTVGFGVWGYLLKHYPVVIVAPFSLLVPIVGTAAAALILDERFGPARLGGMALVLAGLAVVALPPRRRNAAGVRPRRET